DVADDRARAAALQIQLGDVIAGGGLGRLTTPPSARGALAVRDGPRSLQHRDSGLSPVDADQHLLLQFSFSPFAIGPSRRGRGPSCARVGCHDGAGNTATARPETAGPVRPARRLGDVASESLTSKIAAPAVRAEAGRIRGSAAGGKHVRILTFSP